MTAKTLVKFTANFERNLEEIDAFLLQAEAPQAFDALLDELSDTVIPNLERFSGLQQEGIYLFKVALKVGREFNEGFGYHDAKLSINQPS